MPRKTLENKTTKFSIKLGTVIQHFKGGLYTVISMPGKHTETGETLVGIQSHLNAQVWYRPLNTFYEIVERDDGMFVPRFKVVQK